jgi:hypothetical protein
VLMAAMLLLPDVKRLLDLLLFNRTVPPRVDRPADFFLGDRPRLKRAAFAVKIAFLFTALYDYSADALPHLHELYAHEEEAPPFGNWQVVGYTRDGADVPLTGEDPSSVRWLAFVHMSTWPVAEVTGADGHTQRVAMKYDLNGHRILLLDRYPSGSLYTYELTSATTMRLDANESGHPVTIQLRRVNLADFPLLNRGFHWVNEYNFNQ